MTTHTDYDYDVLVAGAGPVGPDARHGTAAGGGPGAGRRGGDRSPTAAQGRRDQHRLGRGPRPSRPAAAQCARRRGGSRNVQGRKRSSFVGHFGGIQVPADPSTATIPACAAAGPAWYVQIPQLEVERILGKRAAELGVEVRRGVEVSGFDAGRGRCHRSSAGRGRRARGLARRLRRGPQRGPPQAGFEFPGTDPTITFRQSIGTVEGAEQLGQGWQHTPTGVYVYGPKPGQVRTVELDGPPADRESPVTAAEMEASLRRVSGADVRVTEVTSAAPASPTTRGRRRPIGAAACCCAETQPTCTRRSAVRA
jgi:hypothetical protein